MNGTSSVSMRATAWRSRHSERSEESRLANGLRGSHKGRFFSRSGGIRLTYRQRLAFLGTLLALLFVSFGAFGQATPPAAPAIHFRALNVYLDSGAQPLAAWQIEIVDKAGRMKIVGVEGGEHTAFKEPPFYDPRALMNDHIILAAFSTSNDLPSGKTRVARLHVQITGDAEPDIVAALKVAGDAQGRRIQTVLTTAWEKASEETK